MSLLDNEVSVGKTPHAPRIIIYGEDGVGKSSWAAKAPDAFFMNLEGGLDELDVNKNKHKLTNWTDFIAWFNDLITEKHEYKTVVIDTITALERFIWAEVCKQFGVKNIEKVDGGYGRGYRYAMDWWDIFLSGCNKLTESGIMVILIGHQGVQEIKDPENQTYHRTAPSIHHLPAAMLCQWCDCVFQAKKNFRVQKMEEGFGNSRGIAVAIGQNGGERVIRTIGNCAVVAKNRYNLPEYLPLDFNAFYSAITENINK
jgi:hypothetical protein